MEQLAKNQLHTAQITGYTSDGAGVCHIAGRAVFVKGALAGETWQVRILKVTANAVYGKAEQCLSPAAARTEPPCPVYRTCGGCSLQHMDYDEQLRMKLERVNDALMAALGAEVTGGLEPAGTAIDGSALTCGRIGKLPEPMTMAEFLPYVAGHLHANGLRYVDGGLPVERLAVCGGSGGNMLELAAAKGCDTFVTADVKYDRFLAAKELGINLIDADHFCTENVVIPVLQAKLQPRFPNVAFAISQVHHQTAQTYCP